MHKCHFAWKEGRSEGAYEIAVLPGQWGKVTVARSEGARAGAREKQQGQGETPGSSRALDVVGVAVLEPAASLLGAHQGKGN